MSTSAQALMAPAPIRAIANCRDGCPWPVARFGRKPAERRRLSGVGRLESLTPAETRRSHGAPARFSKHVGYFSSHSAIMLMMRLCFDAGCPRYLTVADPALGAFVRFVGNGVHLELEGVFSDQWGASASLAQPPAERAIIAEMLADGTLRRRPPVLTVIAA